MAKVINGTVDHLFATHGDVDTSKVIDALVYVTCDEEIDVKAINQYAEYGGMYVKEDGSILEGYTSDDERVARYKVLPTGLKLNGTTHPIFASFIKYNDGWKGIFVGTAYRLFETFSKHYNGTDFNKDYESIFGAEENSRDIIGFGLKDIISGGMSKFEVDKKFLEQMETSIEKTKASIQELKDKIDDKNAKKAVITRNKRKLEVLNIELDRLEKQYAEEKRIHEELVADMHKQVADRDADILKRNEEAKRRLGSSRDIPEVTETKVHITPTEEVKAVSKTKPTKDKTEKATAEKATAEKTTVEKTTVEKDKVASAKTKSTKSTPKKTAVKKDSSSDTKCKRVRKYPTTLRPAPSGGYKDTSTYTGKSQMEKLGIEIYNKLMFKEKWASGCRTSIPFYLKSLLTAINNERDMDVVRGNGYMLSSDKRMCLINTGLIDIYGNFIYIVDKTPTVTEFRSKTVVVAESKTELIDFGFEPKELRNMPDKFQFVSDVKELIFDADIADFDFDDTEHLNHIINERIARFPEKFRAESSANICDRLKNAVEQAIKISKIDYRYVLPKYDLVNRDIQFLIPLYLDTTFGQRPELAIVVSKNRGIWKIFTVLNLSDAYMDARLVCNPCNTWM